MLLAHMSNDVYIQAMKDYPKWFGVFVQPRRWGVCQPIKDGYPWACDNDAFKNFNERRFYDALERYSPYRDTCLFVVAPDVVGNHLATYIKWQEWRSEIAAWGYPVAFVGQDGSTIRTIPWSELDVLFIGGTDTYKDKDAVPIIREAKRRGVWVHVGRVNDSPKRFMYCFKLGVDSIDGTFYARRPNDALRWFLRQRRVAETHKRRLL